MKKSYETQVTIPAPPEAVWRVLRDADALVAAGTGITRIEGKIALGEKIKIWSEVSPDRASALRVRKLDDHEMVWEGGMPLGLFRGVRTFEVKADGKGSAFHMREVFSGPMSGMIVKSMPDLTPSFEKFARALASAAS